MFYANLRSLVMGAIPGAGLASFVYLGIIAFFIAGLITYRKWAPFVATVIFTAIMGFLDQAIIGLATPQILYHSLHMLILPFMITLLYFGRR
jgi:NO-binding membrane sensor protein with MHYT domain